MLSKQRFWNDHRSPRKRWRYKCRNNARELRLLHLLRNNLGLVYSVHIELKITESNGTSHLLIETNCNQRHAESVMYNIDDALQTLKRAGLTHAELSSYKNRCHRNFLITRSSGLPETVCGLYDDDCAMDRSPYVVDDQYYDVSELTNPFVFDSIRMCLSEQTIRIVGRSRSKPA
jgi:hypothetical protein